MFSWTLSPRRTCALDKINQLQKPVSPQIKHIKQEGARHQVILSCSGWSTSWYTAGMVSPARRACVEEGWCWSTRRQEGRRRRWPRLTRYPRL